MLVHFSYYYQYMFMEHDIYNYTVKITHKVILKTVHIPPSNIAKSIWPNTREGAPASQTEK